MKLWFYQRFQVNLGYHLGHPIRDRRDSQTSLAATGLGYGYRTHWWREIAPRGHAIPDLVEVIFQLLLKICNRLRIHSGRSLVCFYPLKRLPNHPFGNLKRLCLIHRFLPFLVDQVIAGQDNPFAPSPLQDFITTTGCSAPVLRIGTLTLVGLPLEFLPWHRSDRFPRSTQEPESRSCHLHAGRHPGSKQVPLGLILGQPYPPVLTSSL